MTSEEHGKPTAEATREKWIPVVGTEQPEEPAEEPEEPESETNEPHEANGRNVPANMRAVHV